MERHGLVISLVCCFLSLGPSYSQYDGLTKEDLSLYSREGIIKEYDIVMPTYHDHSGVVKRSVGSDGHRNANKLNFRAFNEEHDILLERNDGFLKPGLTVEYVEEDGSIRTEPFQSRYCHFFAKSLSHTGSEGALSTCNGVRGILSMGSDTLYIEPLKQAHAQRFRRNTQKDTPHPHLVYKRDAPTPADTFCPVTKARRTSRSTSNQTVYEGPYLGAKYLEIFFLVDSHIYDEFGANTESYVTSIINIMSRRYADPSLDISFRISVVRLMVATSTLITAIDTAGTSRYLSIGTNTEESLDNFCEWQAFLSYDDDTNPNDWDYAIVFTGQDVYHNDGGTQNYAIFGVANVASACTLGSKCGLIEDVGLNAGFVMAHETGHS